MIIFNIDGKLVLFHSASDNQELIAGLKNNLARLKEEGLIPDILVTSYRRFDDPNSEFMLVALGLHREGNLIFDKEGEEVFQIPLLRVRHERKYEKEVRAWYNELTSKVLQTILKQYLQI